MKKTISRLTALVVALLAFVLGMGQAFAIPSPMEPHRRLNDFANVLSETDQESLERELRAYDQETGIEIAVVTVTDTEGQDPLLYARDIMRAWGVGRADQPGSGLVVLFFTTGGANGRGGLRIATGRRMEAAFHDSVAGTIARETFAPPWRAGRKSESMFATFHAVRDHLGHTPWATRPEAIRDPDTAQSSLRIAREQARDAQRSMHPSGSSNGTDDEIGGYLLIIVLVFGAFLVGLFVWWLKRSSERSYKSYGGWYGSSGGGSSGGSRYYESSSGLRSSSSSSYVPSSSYTPSSSWSDTSSSPSSSSSSSSGDFGGGGDSGGGGGGGDA